MLLILDWLKAHWRPVAVVLGLILAFACGRFATPTKVQVRTEVKTVVQTVTVEKKVAVQAEVKTQVVYRDRTVIKRKDGTEIDRDITRTADQVAERRSSSETHAAVRSHFAEKTYSKTEEHKAPDWHVSALVGLNAGELLKGKPEVEYGAHAERRIAGPLWLGVWGLGSSSGGAGGISAGLEF